MLVGCIGTEHNKLPLARKWPVKSSVTLIELMIVTAIVSGLFAILFTTFNITNTSKNIGLEKIELQEQARRLIFYLNKDLHQTSLQEIKANNPSSSHLKFRLCTGYDTVNQVVTWTTDYVEYTYNSTAQTVTRQQGASTQTFNYISQAPFGIDSAWISGSVKRITITIINNKTVAGTINVSYPITTDVTVRN